MQTVQITDSKELTVQAGLPITQVVAFLNAWAERLKAAGETDRMPQGVVVSAPDVRADSLPLATFRILAPTPIFLVRPGETLHLAQAAGNPDIYLGCTIAGQFLCSAVPLAPEVLPDDPVLRRVYDWLQNGQRGTSSETMCRILFQVDLPQALTGGTGSHPHDPDDFHRCHLFLEAVPEARARLGLMRPVSAAWAALVDHWAELEQLLAEELGGGGSRAPRLYQKIQALTGETA